MPTAWALNYGTISNVDGAIEGVHVWTFFDENWDLSDSSYVCAVVQTIEGTVDEDVANCPGATRSFEWDLTTVTSDCPPALANDPFLDNGITGGCIGEVPDILIDEVPHAEATEGWYILDEAGSIIPHGFTYPETLDFDETGSDEPWGDGEPHTLSPAWVWAL